MKNPKWHEAQQRFQEYWLDPKRDTGTIASCMWQETRGVQGTTIGCIECWMVGGVLHIAQFFENGSYIVYRQEGK